MSEMQEKFSDKAATDREEVRAADPEEGITSYQVAHAWEESQAEGDREDEAGEDTRR
ncbi:hypothetical protein [Kitasatospora sp. Root107]|uniref:hypothetical protein n=1 Tax=Kitasatospora sp. Root107 TaxID=1736424 RepID=UPI000AD5509A|nr:hypothetical protein [Kitasatospora sp. Root107]